MLSFNNNNNNNLNTSPAKLKSPKKLQAVHPRADRFIPSRHNGSKSRVDGTLERLNDADDGLDGLGPDAVLDDMNSPSESKPQPQIQTQLSSQYKTSVAEACGLALNTRILEFRPAAPQSKKPVDLRSQYNRPLRAANAQTRRKVAAFPERVLDAPGMIDDYYLNLLDWSAGNQVAIALQNSIYVWDASTGNANKLLETDDPDCYVSSVKWSGDGAYLSVGLSDGDVQIWDIKEQTKLRSMAGHCSRVGVLAWDRHILSSGCRDGSIWNHDVRISQHKVSEFSSHTAEVCGMEWRSDGAQLASGGNDNVVNIWDARSATPKFSKTNHRAAVKALAWCPWQLNLLATGGGTQDKHIHFWNATTGARVNSIDTGSQVTSLKWSTTYKEIVSSHGFPDNHLSIWSYPSLTKNIDIVAHDWRVLNSALSPDGQTLATCASDENLKFWKIFESQRRLVKDQGMLMSKDMKGMTIR